MYLEAECISQVLIDENGNDYEDNRNKTIGVRKTIEVCYWRKTNHIHNWFVNNIQNGVDNCAVYPISIEKLNELIEVCERVLGDRSLAPQLLPTCSGFFFGPVEYDDDYFSEIKRTIKVLKKVLKESGCSLKFYYSASW